MEFDQPKKSNQPHEQKEAKKKKAKKRAPAHVPLPIAEQAEKTADKKVDLQKKPKKRPVKETTAHRQEEQVVKAQEAERPAVEQHEKPKVSLEKVEKKPAKPKAEAEHVVSLREADSPAEKPAEGEPAVAHENEVPLHVETEGEVFVSDRLKTEGEPHTDSEQASSKEDQDNKPRWRQNPQQQQQLRSTPVQPAASAAAASPFLAQWRNRNTGNTSPANPLAGTPNPNAPGNHNSAPTPPGVPPHNPNVIQHNPNLPPNPNALPITSQQVPERVRDRASERRHLVTGLVVGALIEHVRHKRREKRMTKTHKKEVKALEKEQTAAHIERQAEQNKQLREKTALEKTIERLEAAAVPFAAVAANKTPEAAAKPVQKTSRETAPAIGAAKTAEEAKRELEERARKAVEIAHEPTEELEVPKEHRIENSSWHAIEVDKKTGKVVEDQSFAYGEAFHQEQHQEQLRKDSNTSDNATEKTQDVSSVPHATMNVPTFNPVQQQENQVVDQPSRSEKLRDRGADLAEAASHVVGKIQPVDALLWVVLGIVVLVIFKLV